MKDIKKLIINKYLWSLYILATALAIVTIFYEWFIGIALTAVLIIIIILSLRAEDRLRRRTEQYVSTLSYRVKKVGEEALLEMPVGIILYSEDREIEWANPYLNDFIDRSIHYWSIAVTCVRNTIIDGKQ